jgi:hypothetical protein
VAKGKYLENLTKGSPILDRLSSTLRTMNISCAVWIAAAIHTAQEMLVKGKYLDNHMKRSPIQGRLASTLRTSDPHNI